MQEYVLGFMFDERKEFVALIRKNRPEGQRDKLNGIGGKIEEGEQMLSAMRREFYEETTIDYDGWRYLGYFGNDFFRVHFFRAFTDAVYYVKSATDEKVEIYRVNRINDIEKLMKNLKWLIPLCLDESIIATVKIDLEK